MCPICWISGFIAAIFGGSLLAVVNHPISWMISALLIAYAAYKFYEAKQKGKKMNTETKKRNRRTISEKKSVFECQSRPGFSNEI